MRREGERGGSRGFLLTVGLSALVAAAAILRNQPPHPKTAGSPLSQFAAGRAREILRHLVGDGAPHPVGSPANAKMRERVRAELTRLGYTPTVQEAFVCGRSGTCAMVSNVLARLSGEKDGKAVLLCAHYDSVGAGPGASDDGMGVAALLEIARVLQSEEPKRNPVIFLIDDGEEAGLLGAEAFASDHPWAREVGAVVNLENRGTSGSSFLFETSDSNRWLVELAARSIPRPATSSLFYTIYKQLPNDTDLTVFREHGMAGVNFAAIGGEPRYHTPLDNFQNASPATLQQHGDSALAMTRALASADLDAPRRGNAVFFDLFGAGVLRWPEEATPPIAGAVLVLLAAGIFSRWRAGALSVRALAWGLAGGFAMPLAAAAAGFGVSSLLRAAGALPVPWIAHPGWLLTATWAVGLLWAGLVASLVSRRAGPEGLWGGVWMFYGITAFLLALAAAGVSFLLLVPVSCAALLGLAGPRSAGWRSASAVAPTCLAAFFWLPLAWLLYAALGSAGAVIIAAAVGLWAAGVAPTFTLLPARARRAVLFALAALAAIALAGAMRARSFSAEVPERMPIIWQEDADTGRAQWLFFPDSKRLSERIREAAGCSRDPISPYPWSGSSAAFAAPSPRTGLSAPELRVRQDFRDASARRIRATLRSPRGAPVVFLAVPPSLARARIAIGGKPVGPITARWLAWSGGWRVLSCLTTPPEGIEVEIVAAGDAPLELYLGDRSRRLPAGGERLVRARGASGVPSGDGDATVVTRRVRL